MKFLKNKAKKALMAAVTMSLVMGVCGSAMAADAYYYGQNDNTWGTETQATTGFTGVWDAKSGVDKNGKATAVLGGYSTSSGVSSNTVTISGGSMDSFYGALMNGEGAFDASLNVVTVNGNATFRKSVYCASTYGGAALYNTFNINGGNFNGVVFCASTYGGAALYNTFNINGGNFNGVVCGAEAYRNAEGNIVNISGGIFEPETKEAQAVYGGFSYSGIAEGNIVNISGGTINIPVIAGGTRNNAEAKNNTVNLIGNDGKLYATVGYNKVGAPSKEIVEHKGTEAINIGDIVYGSGGMYSQDGDFYKPAKTSSGNTLNVAGKNTTVGNIASFQNLNFYVTQDMIGKSMLIVNAAENANTVLPAASGIKILAEDGVDSVTLKEGDKIILIDKQDAGKLVIGEEEAQPGKIEASIETKVIKSAVEDYAAEVRVGGEGDNDLILTVGAGKNPGNDENKANIAKNMVETRAAGLAIVNEGVDFMVEHGMANAKIAVKDAATAGHKDLVPFVAVGGGKMRYNSGSHIDSNSWHGAVGIAKEIGNMTVAFAVDHGKTSFDSYNDGGVKGSGDSKATGASVMAEVKKDNGVHFDGSIRAGRVKNDYSALTSYDQSSTYYGLSLGGGKEFAVSDKNVVDVYGRYFWTHTNSSDATDNIGTKLEFDAINSHRVRVGGRFTHDVNDISKLYAGLAWQHEFKGDTRATVGGFEAPAPSLKGNTGIMELGWKVSTNKNLDLDLGATGYIGKQKGASLNLALNFKF